MGDSPGVTHLNGVDSDRADHRGCARARRIRHGAGIEDVGVVALEPEKGAPALEPWPAVLRAVPDTYLLIVGEGSRREAQARVADRIGRISPVVDDAGRDRRAGRAVLPSYREARGSRSSGDGLVARSWPRMSAASRDDEDGVNNCWSRPTTPCPCRLPSSAAARPSYADTRSGGRATTLSTTGSASS